VFLLKEVKGVGVDGLDLHWLLSFKHRDDALDVAVVTKKDPDIPATVDD
jgi:hypothetical protein